MKSTQPSPQQKSRIRPGLNPTSSTRFLKRSVLWGQLAVHSKSILCGFLLFCLHFRSPAADQENHVLSLTLVTCLSYQSTVAYQKTPTSTSHFPLASPVPMLFKPLSAITAPGVTCSKKTSAAPTDSLALIPIEKYESTTNLKVYQSGLWINPKFPFLHCSPDGLVGNDTVIEIKALKILKQYSVEAVTSPTSPVPKSVLSRKVGAKALSCILLPMPANPSCNWSRKL